MKNLWPINFGLPLIVAVVIGLASCGSVPNSSPAHTNSSPATLAYVFGVQSGKYGMLTYSTAPANNGSPVAGLQAEWQQGPIATDSAGQIYIAGNPADPLNLGQILVYPPSSAGNTNPSRTINLDYVPNRLASGSRWPGLRIQPPG